MLRLAPLVPILSLCSAVPISGQSTLTNVNTWNPPFGSTPASGQYVTRRDVDAIGQNVKMFFTMHRRLSMPATASEA